MFIAVRIILAPRGFTAQTSHSSISRWQQEAVSLTQTERCSPQGNCWKYNSALRESVLVSDVGTKVDNGPGGFFSVLSAAKSAPPPLNLVVPTHLPSLSCCYCICWSVLSLSTLHPLLSWGRVFCSYSCLSRLHSLSFSQLATFVVVCEERNLLCTSNPCSPCCSQWHGAILSPHNEAAQKKSELRLPFSHSGSKHHYSKCYHSQFPTEDRAKEL